MSRFHSNSHCKPHYLLCMYVCMYVCMYAALTSILIITISVAVPIMVLFILGLVIILCICLCYKYKPMSSKASLDVKTQPGDDTHLQSSQPTQPQPGPVYETIMECSTTVDLEMTENVAYAPIHTSTRKT